MPLTPARRRWLTSLDRDDSPLRRHLQENCSSPRIGLRFESLWHFFITQDPQTSLIAHNLPLREEGRTLGEFDVLYYCHRRQALCHLELAVKFYLFVSDLASALPYSGWLGPNQVDRLDRKLARLSDHQLALSHSPAGRRFLLENDLEVDHRHIQVSGRLFAPRGQHGSSRAGFRADHPRGEWQHLSAFLSSERPENWRYLAKPHWLDAHFESAEPLEEAHLQLASRHPIMLVNRQHECRFLCPPAWPAVD